MGTLSQITNRNLRTNVPLGWTVTSGKVDYTVDFPMVGLARLRGDAASDTILTQAIPLTGGLRYALHLVAHLQPLQPMTPQPADYGARLELHWLTDQEEPQPDPATIVLKGQDFASHCWTGNAPENATGVTLNLIQPQGQGHLILESISFRPIEELEIPLTFLAESPGELTVSNFQVAYDP